MEVAINIRVPYIKKNHHHIAEKTDVKTNIICCCDYRNLCKVLKEIADFAKWEELSSGDFPKG